MNFVTLTLAVLMGAVLGAAYLGALWINVQQVTRARRPGVVLAIGAAVRMTFLLGAFYLVASGDWRRLVACLLGFLLARLIVTRRLRARGKSFAPARG
jgi:F1F0 ATPase subunit 2